MKHLYSIITISLCLISCVTQAHAEIKLSAIFTDHMVLQRNMENPVWGWGEPQEGITVTLGKQSVSTKADAEGFWKVKLSPMKAGGPHTMSIKGSSEIKISDILVGEVWLCSGQSNMQWDVRNAYDADLESLSANNPQIRMVSLPQVGTQEPQKTFNGKWELCTPETALNFSAVGYFFGRQLHNTLNVPIGLIDNSWGGSACEAWVNKEVLAGNEITKPLIEKWNAMEKDFDPTKEAEMLKKWEESVKKAKENKSQPPRKPATFSAMMSGNQRPANIYNGALKPVIGYGIKGVIWYQGESNAGRAYQYRELFPMMISNWRTEWGQGDFPFYWVQLADFKAEVPNPAEADWAELREAQTMTMSKLPNTGEAVIIDRGETKDIHPRDKQTVAKRLSRWALAKDYGMNISFRSPIFNSVKIEGNKAIVTFEHVGAGLNTFDVPEVKGFAVAGEDKVFKWANAKITSNNTVEVTSNEVNAPVSVRYAWANNPVCNLQSKEGLPVTPFRTDDWPGITANILK